MSRKKDIEKLYCLILIFILTGLIIFIQENIKPKIEVREVFTMQVDRSIGFVHKKESSLYLVTNYYTPVRGQLSYYGKSYESDYYVNCMNDCLVTASGYRLSYKDAHKVGACPPNIKLGTRIKLIYPKDHPNYDELIITCVDRGGAIKNKRIDIWAGIGQKEKRLEESVWIGKSSSKDVKVIILP